MSVILYGYFKLEERINDGFKIGFRFFRHWLFESKVINRGLKNAQVKQDFEYDL